MPTASSMKRLLGRHGREVKLVPDAVSGHGAEALLTGSEGGAITCKGLFQEPGRYDKPPQGPVDVMRLADAEGGETYDWLFRAEADSFASAPTTGWRLVDGSATYAVVKVRPARWRQEVYGYDLLLRLI